jgi:photosystem II stability/assembly factor-like uncharacterized protein
MKRGSMGKMVIRWFNGSMIESRTLEARRKRMAFGLLLLLTSILFCFSWAKPAHAQWTSIGPGGGQIYALAIDPKNPKAIYAGTTKGLFKSTDGAGKWVPLALGLADTLMRRITIDRRNTEIIYALSYGGHLYKSPDAGANWEEVNSDLTSLRTTALAINPKNTQTLYVGTEMGGIFKSTNGGTDWEQVNSGLANTFISSLAIDPEHPQTIYAGTGWGVYKSTNGGKSWNAPNPDSPALGRVLAVDPGNPEIVHADGSPPGFWFSMVTAIFKSTDGGTSWQQKTGALTDAYITSIVIDPKDPQTVYAGTAGSYAETPGFGLLKSTNGGDSRSPSGLAIDEIKAFAIDPTDPQTLFASGRDFLNDNSGLFKSIDGGINWEKLTSAVFLSLAIDPQTPQTIYAGNSDGVFKTTDGGATWEAINSGLKTASVIVLALDPQNAQTIYAGTAGDGVFKNVCGGLGSCDALARLDHRRESQE